MKSLINISVFTSICLLPALSIADETAPTITTKLLSKELANTMVVAAVDECAKKGYSVAAAVVGRDGNLAALLRDPLAGAHTVRTSESKAYTSASLQVATSQLEDRPDMSFAPGILRIQGGVAINIGGNFYGGVAVSGADPKDDEKCAQAGIDAIADILEFAD